MMLEEIGSEGILLNSHMSQVNFNIMFPDSLSHHCQAIKSELFFQHTFLSQYTISPHYQKQNKRK